MSVVGFDVGNENCVIAAAKQGGIDVLLNNESKRETPAVVSFGEKQRFIGSAGAACATMNPKSTISQVKRLIGRSFNDADVQSDLRLFPFETSGSPDGGILVNLQYLGERHTFTPVQILAMLLIHLKKTAEKSLETQVSDCVIGIPSYFTVLQRRLYLDAASIAGLKPLRLMHDCTATALGYGIYKTDFANSGPTCVVFIDIGHSDTQVAVVLFERERMKMLSHAFDSNLGSRDFDEVLFRHFAAQFREKYNIDVYTSTRACIRLRAACEKLKKVLSANPEAPLHIECLMDEKDVKGFITRDEFERLSSNLLERISIPCHKARSYARVSDDKIHSVELVGSGSRIPSISRILTSIFGREPRRTLNASECVAYGCTLQSAMLSPICRVKEYEVEDSLPFSIGFFCDDGTVQACQNGVLFPKGDSFPSDKLLTLQKSSPFHLEAVYADQNELPSGVSPKISSFMIGPGEVPHIESAKVEVKACITLHGIVSLASASLVVSHLDETAEQNNAEMSLETVDAKSDNRSLDARNDFVDRYSVHSKHISAAYGCCSMITGCLKKIVHGQTNKTELLEAQEKEIKLVNQDCKVEQAKEKNTLKAHVYKTCNMGSDRKDISMKCFMIPIKELVYAETNETELLEALEKEIQLANQDCKVEQAKEKKNTLEAYVYETHNMILSTWGVFATESEKEEIAGNLQKTEDWLYEDGDDESANVYSEKLLELRKLVDPIENRYKDEEVRAQAARDLLDSIGKYKAMARSLWPVTMSEAVLTECTKSEHWFRDKNQEQNLQPKNVDPVLSSSEIKRKTETLHLMCNRIIKFRGYPQRSEHGPYSDNTCERDDMQVD